MKARGLSESAERMGHICFDGHTRQAVIAGRQPFKNELEEIATGARAVSGQAANGSDALVCDALDAISRAKLTSLRRWWNCWTMCVIAH
jgi:hypothetical protein